MESQQYRRLNPLAFAIAAGVAAIVVSLLIGLPTMGFAGIMNGHFGSDGGRGWMMGGYGNGYVVGFGIPCLVGVFVAALGGTIVAWVYNGVHANGK